MEQLVALAQSGSRDPWNKGKLAGQKAPLRLKEIWAIRIRLQLAGRTRELALFNLAVDSKLRSCDLVTLRVRHLRVAKRLLERERHWRSLIGQFRLFRVPNCSPLSCHSGVGEHLPFAHGLVCKILISAGFVA